MFKMNHYNYTHTKQKYDFTAVEDKKNIFPQLITKVKTTGVREYDYFTLVKNQLKTSTL